MRRRLSRSSRISRAAASPLATRGRSASFMRTSTPAWAIAVPAMPEPMNPAPTTPRRLTTAGAGGLAIPKSFLRAVVAKKIWTSLRETSRSEERRVGKERRSLRDWSSDVCSSDLDSRQISVLHAHVHARLGDRRARYARAHEPCAHDAQAAHDGGSRRVGDPEVLLESGGGEKDLDQLTRDVKIGRASCREREEIST